MEIHLISMEIHLVPIEIHLISMEIHFVSMDPSCFHRNPVDLQSSIKGHPWT